MEGTTQARRRGQDGQALPLFVLMIFVLTGSVAVVTDVSWFWVNQQKMQRAADAGALAGAVYLPGNVTAAYSAARAATKQNGYTDGLAGVVVTPVQDPANRRRLGVTVAGPVGTYFARVFGMNQIAAKAGSKAEFTLPVPMGSPQNYYGVGDFVYNQVTTNTTSTSTDTNWRVPTVAVAGGAWTSPGSVYVNDDVWASESTNGEAQQWNAFGLQALIQNDPTTVIDGLQVRLTDVSITGSGTATNCQVRVETSWNGGVNWSTQQLTGAITAAASTKTLGVDTSYASWGAHAWTRADFSDANFRVRLTWIDGTASCASTQAVKLDLLDVRVDFHYSTTTTTTTTTTGSVASPTGSTLSSQGFWGAVITRGGNRENGDEFSPANDNPGISGHTATNPEYDASGYDYTVITNGANGQVKVYDPTFCETGANGSGGFMGAGDHWIAGSANGVTTVFSLWNENGTAYDTADDTLVATSGATFSNEIQADYSGAMGTPGHPGLTNCGGSAYHNAWWTLASNLAAGRYRVNVNTSSASNLSTNAENMWSLWVNASGSAPQVYGEAKMVAYNNLLGGTQLFYLAQIDAANAGKTVEITLFDPGDVSGNAFLKIKSPNGNAYNYASFTWSADDGTSSPGAVTQIQTASAGGSFFNDRVIIMDISLPNTYGSTGLTPAGETQAGWWKIEYTVSGGNDTTTWQVGIRGSPVHLV
ncbi:MAG: hypothetical protein QOH61_423, partial [Chloroflexota bacterium]|nr:hypothetical protein [Chloroflexota bacterium]